MSQDHNEELFPTIGKVADKTDLIKEGEAEQTGEDNDESAVQQIESLCMKCGEQGVTRMLLTSIPFFREVIVMSFKCEHCGAQNNEIQSAGTIRPEGTVYTARILARSDLNRQIVRSSSCEIQIPELELILPPTERGQLTTVEGLIRDIVADLSQDQPLRRIQDEGGYNAIEKLLGKLRDILGDEEDGELDAQPGKAAEKDLPMPAFTVKLDDPAGNSFIEFIGGTSDPKWNMRTYPRTLEQNVALGLVADPTQTANEGTEQQQTTESAPVPDDEILVFPGRCSSCGHPLNTYMKKVNIPYFKDILIMSTNCDRCGYRDNEVKSGAAISEKGKRITLKVEDKEDLSRDILKSETAGLSIPEINLELTHGTLGGRFTTLEGILDQVYEELSEKAFVGDSSTAEGRNSFEIFLSNLKEVKTASRPFTLIVDDPLANSYVQNIYAPDPDPNMTIELYERTWQQNEELGLNDIKVEGYEEDAEKKKGEHAETIQKPTYAGAESKENTTKPTVN
ncbi:ZPR1 zinc-finger domain-containing protein [Cyathus striatus]|nr:ZPR1 zinc-finger domain-containing protein [Cyathus striatus]